MNRTKLEKTLEAREKIDQDALEEKGRETSNVLRVGPTNCVDGIISIRTMEIERTDRDWLRAGRPPSTVAVMRELGDVVIK